MSIFADLGNRRKDGKNSDSKSQSPSPSPSQSPKLLNLGRKSAHTSAKWGTDEV